MNRFVACFVGAALPIALVGAAHAQQGMPSQSTLSAMGLSGMQIISDDEALAVRGFGFEPWDDDDRKRSKHSVAIAYGHSYASVSGHGAHAHSEDSFYAKGKHSAHGKHHSYAGIVIKHPPKKKHHGPKKKGRKKGNMKKKGKPDHKRGGKGNWQKSSKKSPKKSSKKPHHKKHHKPRAKKLVVFAGGYSRASSH